MSHIVPPMPRVIMKDPRHIGPSPSVSEQSPQGFIEGQRPCLAIFGLLQADKPVGCINTVPREPEQLPFPHTRMNSRENNRLEPGLTGLVDPLYFSLGFSLPPGRPLGALQWE